MTYPNCHLRCSVKADSTSCFLWTCPIKLNAEGHHQEVEGVGDLNPKCSVQKVIAAEAYRQLPPALQKKVTEILKAHPDCARNGTTRSAAQIE